MVKIEVVSIDIIKLNMELKNIYNYRVEVLLNHVCNFQDSLDALKMSVVLSSKEDYVGFHLELGGVFRISGIKNDTEKEKILRTNCAAMLFPFLREKVASLMMMANYPPLYLPSVNFIHYYEKFLKDKKTKKI